VGLGLLPYNITRCNNVTQDPALLTTKMETSDIAITSIKPDNKVYQNNPYSVVTQNPILFANDCIFQSKKTIIRTTLQKFLR
jgi:hypothetical protein